MERKGERKGLEMRVEEKIEKKKKIRGREKGVEQIKGYDGRCRKKKELVEHYGPD